MLKFKLKDILNPRGKVKEMSEDIKKRISTFLSDNQDMLIIVADPKSDAIIVGYKNQLTANRLTFSTGGTIGIVENMLQYNKEEKDLIGQFLLVIDGSIHNIAKNLKEQKNNKGSN